MSRRSRPLRPATESPTGAWRRRGGAAMKFLLSMHINPAVFDALTEEERNEIGDGHGAFIDTITKSGEMITTQALADPSQSAVVRVRGGQPARHHGALPGGQGVPGRLLPDRLREPGARHRARRDDPRR